MMLFCGHNAPKYLTRGESVKGACHLAIMTLDVCGVFPWAADYVVQMP